LSLRLYTATVLTRHRPFLLLLSHNTAAHFTARSNAVESTAVNGVSTNAIEDSVNVSTGVRLPKVYIAVEVNITAAAPRSGIDPGISVHHSQTYYH